MATDCYLNVGDSVSYTKTVGESDIYLFAGITGDFSPNHIDEEAIERRPMAGASRTAGAIRVMNQAGLLVTVAIQF